MSSEKSQMRKCVKAAVKQLSLAERSLRSDAVWRTMEKNEAFLSAKCVLLFWSLPDEVVTHDFVERWSHRKRILLPVVVGDELEIRAYEGKERMRVGSFDIQEPVGALVTDYSQIDLAIIPGVGFDLQGHRLGRGKGYYDRLLSQLAAHRIGVCFPEQIVSSVPCEPWDISMNEIIYR